MAWDERPCKRRGRMRATVVNFGMDFLNWQLPPTRALPLPNDQRLLATGDIVDKGNSIGEEIRHMNADGGETKYQFPVYARFVS
jgi:hypothetical protein